MIGLVMGALTAIAGAGAGPRAPAMGSGRAAVWRRIHGRQPYSGSTPLEVFNDARQLVLAQQYQAAGKHPPRGEAWVFVVADDLRMRAQVHFLQWLPPSRIDGQLRAGDPIPLVYREVDVDGLAMPQMLLLDVAHQGRRDVIVLLAGGDNYRPVVLDFGRPAGKEVVFDDQEAPRSLHTEFADIDGNGKYEMIRMVQGRSLREREDGDRWRALWGRKWAYMVYRLRGGTYRLAGVMGKDPARGRRRHVILP